MSKAYQAIQNPAKALRYGINQSMRKWRRWSFPFEVKLGAKFHGHLSGLRPGLVGPLAVYKARKLSDYQPSGSNIQDVDRLAKQGYLPLNEPYEDEMISNISEKFDSLVKEDQNLTNSNEYKKELFGNDLINYLPEITQLLSDDILQIVQDYYGAYCQVRAIRAYRTYHIPKEVSEEVYNEYWHTDGKTTDHLKLFVNLSKVNESDGPLHLIPKRDVETIANELGGFDSSKDGVSNEVVTQYGDITKLTGGPGSAMLANTNKLLHRAGVPDKGHHRDFVQFYFAPATRPKNEYLHDEGVGGVTMHYFSRLLMY